MKTTSKPNLISAGETTEEIVFAFETDFANGANQRLTEYLRDYGCDYPDTDPKLRTDILIELVKVELELRWKSGQRPTLLEYAGQYPELGAAQDLPPDLIHEAWRVAQRHGVAESLDAFCRDFPAQRHAVLQIERTTWQHTALRSCSTERPAELKTGQRIGDFEVRELLGSGSFAHVYRARQVSLDREVALKISKNRGREARTMASLEHDHIVQVFSESVDVEGDLRMLCMQYVPGTNLGSVIRHMHIDNDDERELRLQGENPAGSEFIRAVDQLSTGTVPFQASALRHRDLLKDGDQVGVACHVGARLAEALHYAHQCGVLHRDIKPDNILVDPFGRPLLADFNLSSQPSMEEASDELFGGSLAWMSPEHIAAMEAGDSVSQDVVDHRSDIYSLGVVLFELVAGRSPFEPLEPRQSRNSRLQRFREQRCADPPRLAGAVAEVSIALDEIVARCMAPLPDNRFQSADELQLALEDAAELRSIERTVPSTSRWRSSGRRILWPVILAMLIPNLIGSAVNISYNSLFILPQLSPQQTSVFRSLMIPFNLTLYPIGLAVLYWFAKPFLWLRAEDIGKLEARGSVRKRMLTFPVCAIGIGAAGWIIGGFIFPAVIHHNEPLNAHHFAHFLIDFAISGLIAITYAFFGLQAVLTGTLYLPLLTGCRNPTQTAASELKRTDTYVRIAQIMAGLLPLTGALLLVSVDPLMLDQERAPMYRVLLFGLIALGMIGFWLAIKIGTRLQHTFHALRGRR